MDAFRTARRDRALAVLEGFHAVKHALRFGAEVVAIVAADRGEVDRLCGELAADVADRILGPALRVPAAVFEALAPHPPRTGVIAIARRRAADPAAVLANPTAPLVLLEDPRDLGNLGACVRVAAAAGAGGVLTTGSHDPWHPDALRGAAGLHYALPVAGLPELPAFGGTLVAVDPSGDDFDPASLPRDAVLAFGGERHGLSDALLARAGSVQRIPMRPGVSSLNLATAVAAVLFAWRLGAVPAR